MSRTCCSTSSSSCARQHRYAILECFPDAAVEARHMNSAKLAEFAPKIGACLIGTWEREYLDDLV